MAPIVSNLLAYGVEINWRLMWFPVREGALLKAVEVRSASIRLSRSDLPPPSNGFTHGSVFDLGQGTAHGDPLGYTNYPVVSFVTIAAGTSGYLEAEVELHMGTAKTRTAGVVKPGEPTPFMLSVQGPREGYLANTAAVVDGVFAAGSRISLSDVVFRLVH